MIKSKKKMFIVICVFALVMLLRTVTYAFFNYTRTGSTNEILVGRIYFNHTQGNTLNLLNAFPESRESARSRNDNYITLQITGLNESDQDVYYKLMLSHGEEIDGGTRIDDDDLRFDLIEVLSNNEEKYILYNESFDTINNTIILKDRVDAGTNSNVVRNYKLRMWLDENILVSDTDENADYTTTEFNSLYATIKVTAKGEMQNVYYYDSFADAIAAVNAESYTSETDRANAVTGIYIDADDNSTNLVFYDNVEITQNYTVSKPVDINLYGYTLSYDYMENVSTTTIIINSNSIIENGFISGNQYGGSMTVYGYNITSSGATTIIRNIDFLRVDNIINNNINSQSNGNLILLNSTVEKGSLSSFQNSNLKMINTEFNGRCNIIMSSTIELEDSYIYSDILNVPTIYIMDATSSLVVTNSTIFADSPGCYVNGGTNYASYSIGIENTGTVIFNSGYVFGTHSALETKSSSKTYVYGGTFESTDHGGFYFAHGSSGVAYIENANINGVSYPVAGKLRPNGTVSSSITSGNTTYTLEETKTSFYYNASSANTNVYLVNCNLSAETNQVIALSGSYAQNLYMSGCTFNNTTNSKYLRVDNQTNRKLYFGYNNNFGNISNIYISSTGLVSFEQAKQNGTIIETNANYKNIVHPQ